MEIIQHRKYYGVKKIGNAIIYYTLISLFKSKQHKGEIDIN